MRQLIYPYLERIFGAMAHGLENLSHYFAICPDCGRNRLVHREGL